MKNLIEIKTIDIESPEPNTRKPNIIFLISEDNSKHFMDLFDPGGVGTPNIRRMAEEGVIYSHAFSNSPVCSVARSTLITGTLATRTGMHLHRKIAKGMKKTNRFFTRKPLWNPMKAGCISIDK